MNRWVNDMRDGFRILASREFWQAFRDYWSPNAISERIDDWVSHHREATSQEPDPKVEARRAARNQ